MDVESKPITPSYKKLFKQTLGYFIAAACLLWVFHNIDFELFLTSMKSIAWGWVLFAVIFDILSYYTQGVRWQLLLRPIGKLSTLKTTQAIYIGLFANEIVPLRVGEVVRLFLVSRWLSVPLDSVIPSLLVERLFDGIWLAIAIGIVAIFVALPKEILAAEEMLGIIVIVCTAIVIYLIFRLQNKCSNNPPHLRSRWKSLQILFSFIERLALGISSVGTSRFFFLSFLASLFILVFQILALWLLMEAYDLHLSIWAGAAVLLILHLGTAIPNAPSNVGTYQFFTVVGLTLFGVEKTLAASFSVVAFLVLTIPLWAIGLYALGHTGMSLATIRKNISTLRE